MRKSFLSIYFHLVFSTKNRADFINTEVEDLLYPYLCSALKSYGAQVIRINGTANHLHILFEMKRGSFDLPVMVREIKKSSNKMINTTFQFRRPFAWQEGYALFSVGRRELPQIKSYIERQKEHHTTLKFDDEWDEIMKRIFGE